MRNTIKNVIKVARAEYKSCRKEAKIFKSEGDTVASRSYIKEAIGISTVINMLEDNEYFNDMAKIYKIKA